MVKCHRCGTCCKNFNAIVPKNESSDLSPGFLEKLEETHGYDYMMDYIDKNSVLYGERCEWLKDGADGTTTCLAYERRSTDCRNWPYLQLSSECPVGKKHIDRLRGKNI